MKDKLKVFLHEHTMIFLLMALSFIFVFSVSISYLVLNQFSDPEVLVVNEDLPKEKLNKNDGVLSLSVKFDQDLVEEDTPEETVNLSTNPQEDDVVSDPEVTPEFPVTDSSEEYLIPETGNYNYSLIITSLLVITFGLLIRFRISRKI